MNVRKYQALAMYRANQVVDHPFIICSVIEKVTKTGKPFLIIEMIGTGGKIEGKVWSEKISKVQLKKDTVAHVNGVVEEYQGKYSITIDQAQIIPDANIDDHLPAEMCTPTMIFDIETIGRDFAELDEISQEYLLNNLEKANPDKEDAKQKTGLYPLFGSVAYIAIMNPNSHQGVILGICDQDIVPKDAKFSFQKCQDEAELLKKFWELSNQYQCFVTYNGNSFDFPFLMFRSAVNRVRVPLEFKPNSDQFLDLQKKFMVGGRGFRLEMVAKSLTITNPKAEGISGLHVSQLYKTGQHQAIVDYVARDVQATVELYQVWKQFLAGKIIF